MSGDLNLLFSAISSNPLIIILVLFEPIYIMPGTVILEHIYGPISSGTIDPFLIQGIGFIVSPFVAALVAGRTGDGKGGSFGGWMIAALIGAAALGVLGFIDFSILSTYDPLLTDPTTSLIKFMLSGAVIGIFYGCFALLFSKSEMY